MGRGVAGGGGGAVLQLFNITGVYFLDKHPVLQSVLAKRRLNCNTHLKSQVTDKK